MWKMTCGLVALVLATAAMAAEQSTTDEDPWVPSLQKPRPARSVHTRDWVAQAWRPDTDPLPGSAHQRWSTDDEEKAAAVGWESQDPAEAALQIDSHGNLDDDLVNSEEAMFELMRQQGSPWVAKRQPPRRLGSLIDLYKDMFHGLSPFVANPGNQILTAKPERRSGRRPAACRFGPFELVCWNAARRNAVMRQRPAHYTQ